MDANLFSPTTSKQMKGVPIPSFKLQVTSDTKNTGSKDNLQLYVDDDAQDSGYDSGNAPGHNYVQGYDQGDEGGNGQNEQPYSSNGGISNAHHEHHCNEGNK